MGHGAERGSIGMKRKIATAGGLTLAASLVTGAASADAATFTVTSLSDSSTTAPYAPGTLRNAVYQADVNGPGADTIVFASGLTGTIHVNPTDGPFFVYYSDLDLQGPGPGVI